MPEEAGREFYLWLKAQTTGDWEPVLSLPYDTDVAAALAFRGHPLYRDWAQFTMSEAMERLLERLSRSQ